MEYKNVCKNPWCKSHFAYTEDDIKIIDGKEVHPNECKKCKSFNEELSGGVTWEDKHYDGNPWLGAHQIHYKVTNYKQ